MKTLIYGCAALLALLAAENASTAASTTAAASASLTGEVIGRINATRGIRSVAPKWKGIVPSIHVAAQDGIVTLTGTVATDQETGAAGFAASQASGVRAVANHIQTVDTQFFGDELRIPHTRPIIDAAIDAVVRKLVSNPAIHVIPDVHWSTADQGIQVCGIAASDADRKAATNAARSTTDLPIGSCMSTRPEAFSPELIRALEANAGKTTIPTVTPGPGTDGSAPAAVPGTRTGSARISTGAGPAATDTGTANGLIPLCAGLTVVTAVASNGDYESIKTVEAIDAKQLRLKYSAESGPPWWDDPRPESRKLTTTHRTVLIQDLATARRYGQIFDTHQGAPESAPGSTAMGTSTAVLHELKAQGETRLQYAAGTGDNFIGDRLKRVGDKPVYLRVLVDGVSTDLPAIQARGPEGKEEFFFLDDEHNPLTLAFRLGIGEMPALTPSTRKDCDAARRGEKSLSLDGMSCDLPDGGDRDTLRVVKISTRCNVPALAGAHAGAAALEESLAKNRSAEVYSIYFAFNSDVIREESAPTLQEIAEVMRRHPDWQLRVSGHTDGIGGDAKNLDLSRRRAAAVKNALLRQYALEATRLDTDGFGKSRPKDTNDTLEGRAHNRRVELTRTD